MLDLEDGVGVLFIEDIISTATYISHSTASDWLFPSGTGANINILYEADHCGHLTSTRTAKDVDI